MNIWKNRAADQWRGELEKDHGRIERRSVARAMSPCWLESRGNWKDLSSLIRHRCERTAGGEKTVTDHYYISDLAGTAEKLGGTEVPNRRVSTKIKIFKASVNPDFLLSVLF